MGDTFEDAGNVSGVSGVLMIPMIFVLLTPPLAATFAGYLAGSFLVQYATLALLALIAVGIYSLLINVQGRTLARRELELLEAVREPTDE